PPVACAARPRVLPSFPTRRSSDLPAVRDPAVGVPVHHLEQQPGTSPGGVLLLPGDLVGGAHHLPALRGRDAAVAHPHAPGGGAEDRKSTRLNSSHVSISYAVFCLK